MARATAIHSRLKLRYLHIFFVHRISHISSRVTYNPLSWRSLIKKKEEKENTCNEYIRSISNSSLHRRRSRFRLGPRVSKLARTPGDKKTIKRNALNRRECGAIVRPGPTRLASFRKLFHGGRNRGSTSSRAPTLKNEHRDSRTDWLVRKKTKRASLYESRERNPVSSLPSLASWRLGFSGVPLLRESVQTSQRNVLACEKEEKKVVTGGRGCRILYDTMLEGWFFKAYEE